MNDDIYHEKLKTLAKSGHGAGDLSAGKNVVSLDNPLCGDWVRLAVDVHGDRIESVTHSVKGCLLCRAAASVIGETAPGMNTDAMVDVCHHMEAMLKKETAYTPPEGWEDLAVFEPVLAHESRHNCVLLPFQAVVKALDGDGSQTL
ncbi:MAG: hypothetical protein CR984_00800 [Proteobacteria bacterium]|nr:MAG: hypothetical protein CR984_00800 [Pseudomonadota bacterium]PIE67905.1 MAG: hypothetical protein CSA23_01550 [Deltaproteobacteria bacterium]